MMNFFKSHLFSINQSVQQPRQNIKVAKPKKFKFFKDLYSKQNSQNRLEKNNKKHSDQKSQNKLLVQKQRVRKSSDLSIISFDQKLIPNGKLIKGELKEGKLEGQVHIAYLNGNTFTGKYKNGIRIQGRMIYLQANCQYQGQFFGENFSGYGKLTYYKGRTIEGEWYSMNLIGKAIITYPNDDTYYGYVDQKLYKHGSGHLFFNNGDKYIGQFNNGSLTGIGTYYKHQQFLLKGKWFKGKLLEEIQKLSMKDANFDNFVNTLHYAQNFQEIITKTEESKSSIADTSHLQTLISPSSSISYLRTQQNEQKQLSYRKINCSQKNLKFQNRKKKQQII